MSRRNPLQLLFQAKRCRRSKFPQTRRHKASVAEAITENNIPAATIITQDAVKPYEQIPGPKNYPFVGSLPHYFPGGRFHKLEHHEVTDICQSDFGMIYKEQMLPGLEMVHIFDPNDIETVFRADGRHPLREAFFTLNHFNKKYNKNTQGLLTSQRETWQKMRRNFQQKMLRPKAVSAYLPGQALVSDDLIKRLHQLFDKDGVINNFTPELYKYAAECVAVVCFNKRLGALQDHSKDSEAARFIDAVDTVMDISQKEFKRLPFYKLFNTPSFRRMIKAQSVIKELAVKYSHIALEEVQKKIDAGEDIDGEHGDLIPYLMSKTELSEDEVLTVISELIFAGVDTTSHHLVFSLFLLAQNQEKQSILFDEIDTHLPNKSSPTDGALNKMSYLKAVSKESHRVLPVAPGNIRKTAKEMVLSGYTIPTGVSVAMHTNWIGKQESYFKDAHIFKPERWLRGSDEKSTSHPFALVPFGFGPRSCIGKRFAEQESFLALIKILQNFRVEYVGDELKIECSITNTPANDMKFKFIPRS